MGRQVNPIGFRLGVNRSWNWLWYSKEEGKWDHECMKIRDYITRKLEKEGYIVGKIRINITPVRLECRVEVGMYDRPEKLEEKWPEIWGSVKSLIRLPEEVEMIGEIKTIPVEEYDSKLLGKWIVRLIEKGESARNIKTEIIEWYQTKSKKKGMKIVIKGRIEGVEMAKKEWFVEGKISLQTLKQNIDYSHTEAYTISGIVGVKVWLI